MNEARSSPESSARHDEALATDTGALSDMERADYARALTDTENQSPPLIRMGNDELILYVRKHHAACTLRNPELGKRIWARINEGGGTIVADGAPSLWSDTPQSRARGLAMVSTQFEFPRSLLPALFTFLDAVGRQ